MAFQPCDRCRRHVESNEVSCPFCGAAFTAAEPRPIRAGRFARAVMFAGAALGGCDQGGGAKPVDKAVTKETAKEVVGLPRVHGVVTDDKGAKLVGAEVYLVQMLAPDMVGKSYRTITDHRGRYTFDEVAQANYKLSAGYSATNERGEWGNGHQEKSITVTAGSDTVADMTLSIVYQQPAMPYGAPPRRHRVV